MTQLKIYEGEVNTSLLNDIIAFVLETAGASHAQREFVKSAACFTIIPPMPAASRTSTASSTWASCWNATNPALAWPSPTCGLLPWPLAM